MSQLKALEKGLTRNSAELAVEALLALPVEERSAHVERVAALFRQSVGAMRASADWSKAAFWAKRAEREPRLLDDEARWTLTWGCFKSQQLDRARQLASGLSSRASGSALWPAVRSVLEGSPDVAALSALSPPQPRQSRLGYEPKRSERAWPAPTDEASAGPLVLALCATERWPRFAATVSRWWTEAAPATGAAVRAVAGQLAVRELLRRLELQARDFGEASALLCAAVRDGGAPPELSQGVLDALLAVSSSLPDGPLESEAVARPFVELALAAARYTEHRTFVVEACSRVLFTPAAARVGLRLVERLLELQPSGALALKALRLVALDEASPPPPWLERALERLSEPPATEWLEALEKAGGRRAGALLPLAFGRPSLVERLVLSAWDDSSGPLKRDLASLVAATVEHQRLAHAARGAHRSGGLADFADALESVLSLAEPGIPQSVEGLWRAVEEKVIRVDSELLQLALAAAPTQQRERALVQLYLGSNPSMRGRLEAVEAAVYAGAEWLADELVAEAVGHANGDVALLAEALVGASRIGAPPFALKPLALELRKRMKQHRGPVTKEMQAAVPIANRVINKPDPGKKKKRKKNNKPTSQRKPRPRDNEELPF